MIDGDSIIVIVCISSVDTRTITKTPTVYDDQVGKV